MYQVLSSPPRHFPKQNASVYKVIEVTTLKRNAERIQKANEGSIIRKVSK